jgi:8-oxo-dGTP diphosphatase
MSSRDNSNVAVGVALVVRREFKLLVQRRTCAHAYGTWSVPGGHLEKWETFEQAALRELQEEAGSELLVSPPEFWTANNCFYPADDKHSVCIFMRSDYIAGKPRIMEPDKADQWLWCRWQDVPTPRMQGLQLLFDGGFDPMVE